jgi:hypothetical protein
LAISVSSPIASDPAGTVMGALPLTSAVVADVYPVLESVTEPVGVGLPLPPLTATVTINACAVVMLGAPGVTVTVGVLAAVPVTVKLTAADGLPLKFVSPP